MGNPAEGSPDMRWPRVRITVRRTMLLVLLAAAALGGVQTWARRRSFRHQAAYFEAVEGWMRETIAERTASIDRQRRELPGFLRSVRGTDPSFDERRAEGSRIFLDDREVSFAEFAAFHESWITRVAATRSQEMARADHYAGMKRKYELAARRPWRSVAPDPPEPEAPPRIDPP